MITFKDYIPSDEDIDKVKLGIIKLLFDNELRLDSANFVNDINGTKQIELVLRPLEAKEE